MQNRPLAQGNISDFREVRVSYENSQDNDYIVHKDEVEMLVEAIKRLHVDPGINPHNGRQTAKAVKIASAQLTHDDPVWWTCPSLNKGTAGARLVRGAFEETVHYLDHKFYFG